jgi:cardiolipin synthase A/B
MDDLWDVVAELGLELHPDRIKVIAAKIESLDSVDQFALAKPSFGPSANQRLVSRLNHAWSNTKETGPAELAAALRGASATATLYDRRSSVDLVWTGPSTEMVAVRHTEQVLCEVIESAKSRLFLVSFVAYHVNSIIRALLGAVDRQVSVEVLLESSSEHGGKVSFDSVSAMKESVPSASVYIWDADAKKTEPGHPTGVVHAKCVVADGNLAFITSANLSTAAMERNIELGVLFRGGHLPNELHRHLEALVSTGVIKRV